MDVGSKATATQRLENVFCDILGVRKEYSAVTTENTEKWDSLNHLNLMMALEEEFKIKVTPDEISELYKDFLTILSFIENKIRS